MPNCSNALMASQAHPTHLQLPPASIGQRNETRHIGVLCDSIFQHYQTEPARHTTNVQLEVFFLVENGRPIEGTLCLPLGIRQIEVGVLRIVRRGPAAKIQTTLSVNPNGWHVEQAPHPAADMRPTIAG